MNRETKARIKETGEIVEVKPALIGGNYIWVGVNGCFHTNESLDFLIFTEELSDVKEKSFPKDDPDYWIRLEHQYAGMAMQGILTNLGNTVDPDYIVEEADAYAIALVEKLKENKV